MAQAARQFVTPASAPAIDRSHLREMTLGDRSLERELLQLFDRQSELLLARMRVSDAGTLATLAHTLKGSAVGVGAGAVALAAESAERAARGAPAECAAAIAALAVAITAARSEIAAILRA